MLFIVPLRQLGEEQHLLLGSEKTPRTPGWLGSSPLLVPIESQLNSLGLACSESQRTSASSPCSGSASSNRWRNPKERKLNKMLVMNQNMRELCRWWGQDWPGRCTRTGGTRTCPSWSRDSGWSFPAAGWWPSSGSSALSDPSTGSWARSASAPGWRWAVSSRDSRSYEHRACGRICLRWTFSECVNLTLIWKESLNTIQVTVKTCQGTKTTSRAGLDT